VTAAQCLLIWVGALFAGSLIGWWGFGAWLRNRRWP
jgi:hypothetical protein